VAARLSAPLAVAALVALAVLAPAPAVAQDDVPLPRPMVVVPTDPPNFKTTRSLVTVDCVVTDDEKRQVTDLTPEDFEVKYGGKVQKLTHVVYVPMRSGRAPAPAPAGAAAPAEGAVAPTKRSLNVGPQPGGIRAEQVTRTVAIVVDDLGLSFESTVNVRNALRKFVDDQVAPGDLVAVLRTSGGIGALQQFTTDKRLLQTAIDRVQWTVASRTGVSAFEPVVAGETYTDPTRSAERLDTPGGSPAERSLGASQIENSLEEIRTRVLATGTLGALSFVVRGVKDLPGRKAVVFASEGFDLFSRIGAVDVWNAFVRLMDEANRAGVVIYTLDGRGLQAAGLTAEDNPQLKSEPIVGGGGNQPMQNRKPSEQRFRELILGARDTRTTQLRNSEEVMYYLAQQTGGLAFLNTNDLSGALGRALDDLKGYYLLGYDLPDDKPRGWDPGRVSVKVKRPGMNIRWRQGIFGPGGQPEPGEKPSDPVLMAAVSPFAAGAVNVRLTSLFGHDATQGAYIRSLLFIDPNALTFAKAADDRNEAKLDLVLLAVGDNGQVPGNWRRTITLRLTDAQLEDAQTQGVVYHTRMVVKQPGAYQVRTAIRDMASGAMGSASQFIDIPRVGKGRLAASGVLLRAQQVEPSAEGATDGQDDVLGAPPVRIFKPGSKVVYAYQVYDGLDADDALQVSTALLRDGKSLYRSPETPVAGRAQKPKDKDTARVVPIAGLLTLGDDVPPGPYTLQVIVNAGKRRTAYQYADFEVRR
jgi:VWFA-related protein